MACMIATWSQFTDWAVQVNSPEMIFALRIVGKGFQGMLLKVLPALQVQ